MKPLTKIDLQLYEIKRHIENGWCKGEYEDANGNVCIWGAIIRATGVEDHNDLGWSPVARRLEATLAKKPWLPQSLVFFNDSSTKEAVLGLIDETIEAAG